MVKLIGVGCVAACLSAGADTQPQPFTAHHTGHTKHQLQHMHTEGDDFTCQFSKLRPMPRRHTLQQRQPPPVDTQFGLMFVGQLRTRPSSVGPYACRQGLGEEGVQCQAGPQRCCVLCLSHQQSMLLQVNEESTPHPTPGPIRQET